MTTQSNDKVDHILSTDANKHSAYEARPLNFYDADRYAFITIDPAIVGKLRLTRDDLFTQEITSEGILLRRQKESI